MAKSETGLSAPFSTDPDSNWVAREGGLPRYMRRQARLLMLNQGYTKDDAIPAGIRAVLRWSDTGETKSGKRVSPQMKTLADNATAEFRAKAASARAKSALRKAKRKKR